MKRYVSCMQTLCRMVESQEDGDTEKLSNFLRGIHLASSSSVQTKSLDSEAFPNGSCIACECHIRLACTTPSRRDRPEDSMV